jgi:hypothetical protein
MDPDAEIPTLDPRAFASVMKLGGKKKLDALMALLSESAPARLKELAEATTLGEAKASAQALKTSAGNLGLARLEDLCDQILTAKTWTPGSGLVASMEAAFKKGHQALLAERSKI